MFVFGLTDRKQISSAVSIWALTSPPQSASGVESADLGAQCTLKQRGVSIDRVKLKEVCLLSARLAFSVFTTAGAHKSCDITSCHVQPPHIPRGAGGHPPLSE